VATLHVVRQRGLARPNETTSLDQHPARTKTRLDQPQRRQRTMPARNIIGTPLQKLWYTWRSHRFPWRKTYFVGADAPSPTAERDECVLTEPLTVGMDLEGNTFWEFRDRLQAHRPRRTVVHKDKSRDWADYAGAVSPAWHQWLRAAREAAPSIAEQEAEMARRTALARNAALADARWLAKPSLLNAVPHPPPRSKSANDSGLQRAQDVGRGEIGAELGGTRVEGPRDTGETAARAHDRKGEHSPWADAEKGRARGFKAGEWDPNAALPRRRGCGGSE